jgi:hypothetical protein
MDAAAQTGTRAAAMVSVRGDPRSVVVRAMRPNLLNLSDLKHL